MPFAGMLGGEWSRAAALAGEIPMLIVGKWGFAWGPSM